VALGWLVLDRTGSPLNLGFVSGAQALATISFSLLGGVIADRVDRRRLLVVTQLGAMACSLTLATLVFTDVVQLWQIIAVAFIFGSFQAFDQPTRAALLPHLVAREDMMNAVALTSAVWQSSRIIGPTIAGIVIAFVGVAACFYLTAGGFLTMVVAVLMLRLALQPMEASGNGMVADLLAGLRYIRRSSLFMALISMSFFNAVFGLSYVVLMPVFAREVYAVGPQGLGLLYSASGIGALTGTFIVASLGDFPRKGLLIVGGAIVFGTLLIAFSLSPFYQLSLAILVVAGASTSLYMTSTNTLLQLRLDDQFRGRVMGVYSLTWSLMPLGGVQAGAIATVFSAPVAVAFGGVAVVLCALFIGATQRDLRSLPAAAAASPA
jgi:MFS transporter, DHA1 family, staphyloferrin A biosynthesis exporter